MRRVIQLQAHACFYACTVAVVVENNSQILRKFIKQPSEAGIFMQTFKNNLIRLTYKCTQLYSALRLIFF